MLAHSDGELAQISGIQAVDSGDQHPLVGDGGEFTGTTHRHLGAQRLDLVV